MTNTISTARTHAIMAQRMLAQKEIELYEAIEKYTFARRLFEEHYGPKHDVGESGLGVQAFTISALCRENGNLEAAVILKQAAYERAQADYQKMLRNYRSLNQLCDE